jgi:hypothetical protein
MENLFKSIIGEQLSSVEFIQDYLQLHFDGNTLTLYSWPQVNLGSLTYKHGDIMYRNALCEIISHEVDRVVLLKNTRVTFYFDDDSRAGGEMNEGINQTAEDGPGDPPAKKAKPAAFGVALLLTQASAFFTKGFKSLLQFLVKAQVKLAKLSFRLEFPNLHYSLMLQRLCSS